MTHSVTPPPARIKRIISQFPRKSIMVIGDAMLDEYLWGDVSRISPEAPVPVVEVSSVTLKLGGAANVAANLASLGVTPLLVSICGADSNSERLRALLSEHDMDTDGVFSSKDRPTTLKTRIVAQHQQIVRADHERRHALSEDEQEMILAHVRSVIADVDAVILSDYAKGVLTPALVKAIIDMCREHKTFVAVDPKTHDFTTYAGASVITPNLKEALAALGKPYGKCTDQQIRDIGWSLVEKASLPSLLITLGEQGMAVFEKSGNLFTHLHTAAREVFDVTGAGDTVISTYTAACACKATPYEAAYIANFAAGITVAELGTATVDRKTLLKRCVE